jgi:hypothetical protein
LLPAVVAAESVTLFEATPVTSSGFGTNFAQKFVFKTSQPVTVYCDGAQTAHVTDDNGGPPIVDNFMTAGNDLASICQGGSAIQSGGTTSGTHCFASGNGNTTGVDIRTTFNGTGVTAPVQLTDGENTITFKLWDYGVVYGNTPLQLALPNDCSTSPPVVDVGIDIKPGSYPNSINLCSNGVVTVAILGSADLDVSTIDPSTLKLGTVDPRMVGRGDKSSCNIKDVSGDFSVTLEGMADGFDDLVCQYETIDLGDLSGSGEATVTGSFYGGQDFEGTDTINIVKDGCLE